MIARRRGHPGRRPRRHADPEHGAARRPRSSCWWRWTSTPCRRPASRASTPSPTARRSQGTDGVGVGALAVGNVKFKTEHELLAAMRDAEPRRYHRRRRGVRGRAAACRRPEPVLICALSGRALAQAARAAGFAPIVLDAFGDLDTRAVAERWRRMPVDRQLALPAGGRCSRPRRGWRRRRCRWSGARASTRRPALLAELAAGRPTLGQCAGRWCAR